MIELNNKTKLIFLDREWIRRMEEAGIDMSDATYYITNVSGTDYITIGNPKSGNPKPTYSVNDIMDKLPDWIYPRIDDVYFSGGFQLLKGEYNQYCCYYHLRNTVGKELIDWISSEFGTLIECLASLLIQCHNKKMLQ